MFDIDEFTAVINPPGSRDPRGGRDRAQSRGAWMARSSCAAALRLTMSCDHRVIDGATGAAFLQDR